MAEVLPPRHRCPGLCSNVRDVPHRLGLRLEHGSHLKYLQHNPGLWTGRAISGGSTLDAPAQTTRVVQVWQDGSSAPVALGRLHTFVKDTDCRITLCDCAGCNCRHYRTSRLAAPCRFNYCFEMRACRVYIALSAKSIDWAPLPRRLHEVWLPGLLHYLN